MKNSIKPYSKDISEVQRAFYKSTKDYLIPAWCITKRKIKSTRRSKNLRISCEQNKNRGIPIIVEEERWDAFRGIPKLRCLSLLEIFTWGSLGIPKLELLSLRILLISIPPRSSNTSFTQNLTKPS